MSRDEAEAVIAHEISHIANGDMVTMTLIQGPLDQGHGNHIAIGDVADFMGNDRFRFITAHVLQQPGADGDQRGVTTRAGGDR